MSPYGCTPRVHLFRATGKPKEALISHIFQSNGHNPPGQRRIIVLNDSEELLELMKMLLEEAGHAAMVMHASEGAYRTIKELKPALLILDVVLEKPDSGWQLLQILKLDAETSEIPVIVCSADSRFLRDNEERLSRLGCYILRKPFDIDEMLAMVGTALSTVPNL
jgi:DNA-binding response OmpR family regulator